jgi:hypothetical protein
MPVSNTRFVIRAYVFFSSLPSVDCPIVTIKTATALFCGIHFQVSDSSLYAGASIVGVVALGATGVVISTGTYILLDISVDTSGIATIVDAKVNNTAVGQFTVVLSSQPSTQLFFGGDVITYTADMYVDDVIVTNTLADYPIGAGYVNHFVPTSDGTHNIAGSNDFERGNTGTDIINSTTTAFQLIDDVPLPSGAVNEADDQLALAPPNATDYVECIFGPAPGINTPTVAPRAVEVILAYHQIGTQNGSMKVNLNDNGTVNTVFETVGAAGVTTYRYARKHYALALLGGAWTLSGNGNFNNLRDRFYSADAAPDQCLDAIMIEAEFAEVVGGTTYPGSDGCGAW